MSRDKEIYSPKGEKLNEKEIKEYISIKKYLIKKIKSSSKYNQQLENDDMHEYEELVKKLQFRDENGDFISDEEVNKILLNKEEEER